eukprot:768762-Hanusia_phi.AAC.4
MKFFHFILNLQTGFNSLAKLLSPSEMTTHRTESGPDRSEPGVTSASRPRSDIVHGGHTGKDRPVCNVTRDSESKRQERREEEKG